MRDKLKGKSLPQTHLDRYQRAHNLNAKSVLHVVCPYCGVPPFSQCKKN